MEYIKRILPGTNYDTILKLRMSQLERQDILDHKLEKLVSKCPMVISRYLLLERHRNRVYTFEHKNTSLTEQITNLVDPSDTINHINNTNIEIEKIETVGQGKKRIFKKKINNNIRIKWNCIQS